MSSDMTLLGLEAISKVYVHFPSTVDKKTIVITRKKLELDSLVTAFLKMELFKCGDVEPNPGPPGR